MGRIDLFKASSLVIQATYNHVEESKQYLLIGKGYASFLFFDLSPISLITRVTSAKLTLFKIPIKPSWDNCVEWQYEVAPLLEYINVYGEYYKQEPEIEKKWAFFFKEEEEKGSLQLDLTEIVNQWLIGSIENKGILLQGNHCSNLIQFASPNYEVAAMCPFLRITYETEGDIPSIHPRSIMLPNHVTIVGR